MFLRNLLSWATAATSLLSAAIPIVHAQNATTYNNPIIPGWHSDPSCIQKDGTYFCVISTFIAFPGLPVYASKDLQNWRLASHAWSRESQLPDISWATEGQTKGMFAATIRERDGIFYVICEYLGVPDEESMLATLFSTTDPFNDDGWSDPVTFDVGAIDPDLFWDDDGTVWMATHGVYVQTLDMETGELGERILIWEGTGGVWPEGPHIYKKDGWYYLMIAEGGTGSDHSITIARAESVTGPYEAYENNPILTNRDTDEFIQNVGHGDLFQDPEGNWWGLCLAVRHGPDGVEPMGRESFLFNATWNEGEWPQLEPVRGTMPGSLLPAQNRDVDGKGHFVADPDDYDFSAGDVDAVPTHFMYWRVPREGSIAVTSEGLEMVPSRNNVTGVLADANEDDEIELTGQRGMSFVGRRQSHTLFSFAVDLAPGSVPTQEGFEAGVTIFRTQVDHADLGVAYLEDEGGLVFRFRAISGDEDADVPETEIVPVPEGWEEQGIRLMIEANDATQFEFSAVAVNDDEEEAIHVGSASAHVVSFGGLGEFVGSLLGTFATCNGAGEGEECPEGDVARFTRWTYEPVAQQVDHDEFVEV